MEALQRRVESWIRDQSSRIPKVPSLPQIQWLKVKWPPWSNEREQRKKLQEEYERRRKQLHDLCHAVKAESVSDLQDILCCMVLSECVYKRPATELVRAVNKFKSDFGGQVVPLERVQPSLDHVPHRYLLAEAGDTLFASFIGTKQYKDVMADVNIFQRAIFHEDAAVDFEDCEAAEPEPNDNQQKNVENLPRPRETKPRRQSRKSKPAAHRGFMARAKGIPALELYRFAQKKKRKLVLCGHSLGGAVAALSTLAILRVIAASSSLKENERFQVKCITFSQPPVGNSALRDYVNEKGWQHYFKTYCIPEDLVPRLLSPAYFDHYNAQIIPLPSNAGTTSSSVSIQGELEEKQKAELKKNGKEQLVLGVGPIRTSFWRLSRLVPLEGVTRHLSKFRSHRHSAVTSIDDSVAITSSTDDEGGPQSLEIQEDSDSVALEPISNLDKGTSDSRATSKASGKRSGSNSDTGAWRTVPYLPSYVPFGKLYLLGTSSVEFLSDAEYSNLTSVKSVIAELRERFQSHSMKSYRARFQRIYDLCINDNSSFLAMDQLQQFPHLHQWLGLPSAANVELGHIVESPSIRTATSIAPLGWNGTPGGKNAQPLKVDITGFGLHSCTLVQAQVNGNWCSTTVESFPSGPNYSSDDGERPELEKMRVLIEAPLRRPPSYPVGTDSITNLFPAMHLDYMNLKREQLLGALTGSKFLRPGGLSNFIMCCTSDFSTVSREVDVRTRRVRFLGLEGAGKTSLLKAILDQTRQSAAHGKENLLPEVDVEEGFAGGLLYMDKTGVKLQELNSEVSRFRDELWMGVRDLSRKIDLIVLVHNLAHKIPRCSNNSDASQQRPALSLLLDEAKALGVPWVLAITNKFSVSADQQKAAIDAVLQAYQASSSNTEVLNSFPYVVHTAGNLPFFNADTRGKTNANMGFQSLILGPLDIVRRPFQRKSSILPAEGVSSLCQLVHRVLRSREESSFQEFTKDRLQLEMARDRAAEADAVRQAQEKASSVSAAGIGASIGIVLAVVLGAASALRKP